MEKFILVLLTLISQLSFAQKRKDKVNIYKAVVSAYYKKNASVVIAKTSYNEILFETDLMYRDAPSEKLSNYIDTNIMTSDWEETLKKAERLKTTLKVETIPKFSPDSVWVQFASRDSISWAYQHEGFINKFKVGDRLDLSNILFFRKRAIVALRRISDSRNSESLIFFLEKRNGKWTVVSKVRISLS